MKISIFGMGYVGTTSAACLLRDGHEIIGIDIDEMKVNNLRQGKTPMIYEKGIEKLLKIGYKDNKLTSASDPKEGVVDCDMIWVCVGTPSKFDGGINLRYIDTVIKDIGHALKTVKNRPLIVIRSTCLPGSMDEFIKPLFEKSSNLVVNKDIDLVFHPEFLREGIAIEDFDNPSKIVIGEDRKGASDILLSIYKNYNASFFILNFRESEMVKYCDNLFHVLKITFANEVASISKSIGIDSRKIANIYCSDKKLNISSTYLYPGPPFGGSCLPKDLRAMARFASINYIQIPMLKGIIESNKIQINNFIMRILSYKPNKVGMIGIAFKPGTDDMRESPYVDIAKTLIGEGIEVRIYDQLVYEDRLVGSNKRQAEEAFRNLDKLLVSSLDDLHSVDLIIINHSVISSSQVRKWIDGGIKVIDMVGIKGIESSMKGYEGIYW